MTDRSISQVPSVAAPVRVEVLAVPPPGVPLGGFVAAAGAVPPELGVTRDQLAAAGFTGRPGSTHVTAGADGSVTVAVGLALADDAASSLRDAAAGITRALAHCADVAIVVPPGFDTEAAAGAIVEGATLARYRYDVLRTAGDHVALGRLVLVTSGDAGAVRAGAERGGVFARATMLARDLANTPHSHLTASIFAELAEDLGAAAGLDVEVFDEAALTDLGIGGLLCINAGSAEPPRMIRLRYRPEGAVGGGLALVGKGVMYDSGGISLKPSDRVHAQMKNDMSGAAAVFAAMLALPALRCPTPVTGYLMCTDNMPSGTATGLGDVITIRGGTTVEMIDTDAEGRVVMADALVLAGEDAHDAVIDIATLTGSAMRALGSDLAAVFGNDDAMIELVRSAAATTGELVWQLPLHRPYLPRLDSLVADIANCAPIGHPDALLAALFLARFAGDLPWAHVDMCGQAQNDDDRTWHPKGCTGWGTRLLLQAALDFASPVASPG